MGEGLSVADALALRNTGSNGNNEDGAFGGNGAWWVIILILFFAFAGWGNGRNNGNGGSGNDSGVNTVVVPAGGFGGYNGGYNACCTPATQQGMTDAFNFNQIDNGQRSLERGMCDSFYTVANQFANQAAQTQGGFADVQATLCQGFNGTQNTINQGINSLNSAIAQTNYNMQNCCCETQQSIMQNSFNNQTGFNNVATQIASAACDLGRGQENIQYSLQQAVCSINAEADRNADRIINHMVQNEMDSLRSDLAAAQAQLSQNAQTNAIVSQLLPVAKPAYLTCSPYAAMMGVNPFANNNNCCGC